MQIVEGYVGFHYTDISFFLSLVLEAERRKGGVEEGVASLILINSDLRMSNFQHLSIFYRKEENGYYLPGVLFFPLMYSVFLLLIIIYLTIVLADLKV